MLGIEENSKLIGDDNFHVLNKNSTKSWRLGRRIYDLGILKHEDEHSKWYSESLTYHYFMLTLPTS